MVALNPQFLFISGSVSNDNLLAMVVTIGWWQILRATDHPERLRQWTYVGALVGVAFLSKVLGGLVLGFVTAVVLVVCAVRRRSVGLLVKRAGVAIAPALAIAGWWFARNQVLYGDAMGWRTYQEVFAANLRHRSLRWHDLSEFASVQFRSFWGVFGWMNVDAPNWHYWIFGVLCALGLAGLVAVAVRDRRAQRGMTKCGLPAIGVLGVAVLAQEAYQLAVITGCNESCYQGRYLFPAIAPLVVLLSWGLTSLVPKKSRGALGLAVMAITVALAVFALAGVTSPAYESVPLPKWRLWFVPNRADFEFGDMFRLVGYDVSTGDETSTVALTIYWQRLQPPDFN